MIAPQVNKNILQKEIIADTFPLENAVKKPEETILKPLNKKLKTKILKALIVILISDKYTYKNFHR